MSYLEQSTRYIPYDIRLASGHYRYRRDPEILESPLGARFVGDMDRMFDTYGELLPQLQAFLVRRLPKLAGTSDVAYRQSIRARALDGLRGLLHTGALSNVGIYGSGQSFERLLLRMRVHPLPEARAYADLILTELRKVIPSFLSRVDRPERGGAWSSYLDKCHADTKATVARLWPVEVPSPGASVSIVDFDPAGEDKVLAAMCYPFSNLPAEVIDQRVRALSSEDRLALVRAYVGERTNRRHVPGRALERTFYRFDVVSDYGAFRDLQRHRMLTIEWQRLGPDLGYDVPEIVQEAALGDRYSLSMERSKSLHDALAPYFPEEAAYAVALGFNIRYVMEMSAREAMHLIELRSGVQGHPTYRTIAHEMHRLIEEQAGHHAIAEAMSFVDHGEHELGRLQAEERSAARRAVIGDGSPLR
jgi:thymidylate synthase ThyX